ncbi:DUF4347 domain-containing protein, partial [uncultured Massilia sp.]|uniref:DUF4347 domain-containing protein n=1 Tax=uncultured Massilia sp. TaxID=169973 RepID=UPI0025828681
MSDRITPPQQEIAFVNADLVDLQTLIAGMRPGIDIVLLDPAGNALAQIAHALEGRTDLAAIHLVGHGASGLLQLGGHTLDAAHLRSHADVLAGIGAALADNGDILVYGCATGADDAGAEFVRSLSALTGADVAASNDASGGASAGGDWDLETAVGQVGAASAFATADDYAATLALSSGIVQSASPASQALMVQDANGNIYLAHFQTGEQAIALKLWNGTEWTLLATLTPAMTGDTRFYEGMHLSIGADGNLNLLFRHDRYTTDSIASTRGLKYGEYDLATHQWTTSLIDQGSHPNGARNYDNPMLAHTADGVLHMVYNYAYTWDTIRDYAVMYASSTDQGATWTRSTVVLSHSASDEVLYPTILTDSSGAVHMFYVREENRADGQGNLYHIVKQAGSGTWSAPETLASDVTSDISVATDGAGHFSIAYEAITYDDTPGGPLATIVHIVSNDSGAWTGDDSLSYPTGASVQGLQYAAGKLYMLVRFESSDSSHSELSVLRKDGNAWTQGYEGEARLPLMSVQDYDYFTTNSFIVTPGGDIIVVSKSGEQSVLEFTAGSSDDFGLFTNRAPAITGLDGDATAFTPGAPDLVEDGAFIDAQPGGGGVAIVADADGGDFDGGNIRITRTAGTADGFFQLDFEGGYLRAGPDRDHLGGALRAGEAIFARDASNVWTEVARIDATRDGQDGRDLVLTFTSALADADTASNFINFLMFSAPSAGARSFSLTVSDGDGGTSSASQFTMTGRDIVQPLVTGITSSTANGARKIGDTVSIQVSFSEAVLVTGTPTLQLETGAVDRVATYASGTNTTTLTFTYTVQAGDLSSDLDVTGTTALSLAGGRIRDAAGNDAALTLAAPGAAGSLGAAKAIRVDGLAPTDIALDKASVTTLDGPNALVGAFSSVDGTPQDSFSYTLVAGPGADDNAHFTIAGATLRALDPAALGDGVRTVRVRTTDAAGNSYEEALAITVSSAPTVAITSNHATLGVNRSATITFTFSSRPVGFLDDDVSVAGGVLGPLAVDPLNDKVYTATFTPSADTQDLAAAISVGAGKFTDAGSLPNVASNTLAIGGDTLAPSVTIGADRTTLKANQAAIVTFTFSETPSGFDAADVTVSGGQLNGLAVTADPKVYTATFTPTADTDSLAASIGIAAGFFTDVQGNANRAATPLAIGGDTRAPLVSDAAIAISGASGTGGAFIAGDTISATWNDGASGDANTDTAAVTVDFSQFGGPASVAATRAGGVWSASWQIPAGALDATGRNVAVTAVDVAGNAATRLDGSNAIIDNQAPAPGSAAISLGGATGNGGLYKVGDVVTARWDSAIDGTLDAAGVRFDFSQFGGGQVDATRSGSSWSASYTIVAANIDAANRSVSVAVVDDAGNSGVRAAGNVGVDAILPHVTGITVAGAPAPNAASIDYIVEFDAAVTGVDLADFSLARTGTASGALAGITGSGTTWTVSVDNVAGSGTLRLDLNGGATGILDGAGNAAAAGYAAGSIHGVSFNAAPVITSNGGGASVAFNVAEKQRAVTTVVAGDADGHAISYGIGGADAALFEIDAQTGVLRFISAPRHANALDSGHDNVYDVIVTASDTLGASDSQALAITVLADLDGDGTPDADDDDIDNDGRPNSVEDPVPGAFGGTGDGNGDGIPDSIQLNVASLPTVVAGAPFATLEVAPGLMLSSVASIPAASGLPRNVKMPVGQFDFTIGGVTPGGTAQMSIYVDSAQKVNAYYKKDAAGNWVNLATSVATVGSKTKITFSLTDGGQFDSDGVVNGSISDPGGLATVAPAITSNGGQPSASLALTEGATAVTTVQAGPGASYAITGGADLALFQIDAASGALRFVQAPRFGTPLDHSADNVYDVSVTASDAFGSDTQALSVRVTATPPAPPSPPAPPPSTVIDGVEVGAGTRANGDGSTSQVISIPVIQPGRQETVGNNTVADIPLVSSNGKPVLSVQVPLGTGLQASGTANPTSAADALAHLIREIKGVTVVGSHDQGQMTGGGSGFLSGLPSGASLLVQTVTPTAAAGTANGGALVIQGAAPSSGGPLSALVIDAKGLPGGSVIQLQNVDFAAIVGAVTVTGGAGSQTVWGDGASQTIFLGADDDILHGGAGDDIVGSAGGNDRI